MPTPPYAIGSCTAAAIRSRPRPDAPLVSQLLLGEPVLLGEVAADDWRAVRRAEDGLEGYVMSGQLLAVSERDFHAQLTDPAFALELFQPMLCGDYGLPVTCGARLPHYDGLQCSHLEHKFVYSGQVIRPATVQSTGSLLVRLARRWLQVPELPGGRTPTGVDGVGLLQLIYRLAGHQLPFTLEAMVPAGRPVDFVEQCQEGDIAFFDNGQGKITHGGLVLADSQLLHVSARVRTDGLDHYGIFDYGQRRYTHRLRVVRRWLAESATPSVSLIANRSEITADARQLLIF